MQYFIATFDMRKDSPVLTEKEITLKKDFDLVKILPNLLKVGITLIIQKQTLPKHWATIAYIKNTRQLNQFKNNLIRENESLNEI